jgi:uncharacterized protein (TIGR02246 family)
MNTKKLMITGLTSLLIAASCGRASAADSQNPEDEKAIRSLIARMAEDWNKHDMKSFMSQFTDQGDVVNRFGQMYKGRARVTQHLTMLHASPFRDRLAGRDSTVESVRLITPDVAVAHERCKEAEGGSRRSYVLAKKDGRWKVESCTIVAISAPGPPAKG